MTTSLLSPQRYLFQPLLCPQGLGPWASSAGSWKQWRSGSRKKRSNAVGTRDMSALKSPCPPHLQRKTPVKFQAGKITKFPLPHIATGSSDNHEGIKQKRVTLFTQTALGPGLPSQPESRSHSTVFFRGPSLCYLCHSKQNRSSPPERHSSSPLCPAILG